MICEGNQTIKFLFLSFFCSQRTVKLASQIVNRKDFPFFQVFKLSLVKKQVTFGFSQWTV